MRTRPSFLLSLACAALIAACERVGSDAAAEQATVDAVTQLPAVQPLLERMIAAQESVRFQGERHVEAHWQVGTTHYDLQYLERVSADGAGRFSIEPIDLIEPVLPPGQEDLFLAMSHAREGFYWRYRDFRIHNKPNLLRNYVIHDSGAVVKVLGRDCADLTVRRSHDPSLIYELAVDLKSGLVLRSRELARDGTLIGLSEYTSIDFAADLSNVAWHQATVDEQPLADPNAPLEIGTGAHQPSMIEKGFMLLCEHHRAHGQRDPEPLRAVRVQRRRRGRVPALRRHRSAADDRSAARRRRRPAAAVGRAVATRDRDHPRRARGRDGPTRPQRAARPDRVRALLSEGSRHVATSLRTKAFPCDPREKTPLRREVAG
jgi:hypothetical protein